MTTNRSVLPVVALIGDRANVQRVKDLLAEFKDRVEVVIPGFLQDSPAMVLAKNPAAVIVTSGDESWVGMVLREYGWLDEKETPIFVVTNRPGALSGLLPKHPNAKFFDGTATLPLENWYTTGLLAEQIRAVVLCQEP